MTIFKKITPKRIFISDTERWITKNDLKILGTHKFEEVHSDLAVDQTFRCKVCLVEADYSIHDEVISVFYGNKNEDIEFTTCKEQIMKTACE